MVRVLPPGGAVDWPRDEGVLGVVGLAPWSTLEFCRALYAAVHAAKDWHFPRVLLDINTKIPSRGRHLQLGETDPSAAISATIKELAGNGATCAVVVSNTAHILFERWSKDAPIPILHIVEETLNHARDRGARNVTPLVSASTAKNDLYGSRIPALGLTCTALDDENQTLISQLIEAIKVSGSLQSAPLQAATRELFIRLKALQVDTVIAGCTELSILAEIAEQTELRLIDSNSALAHAALRHLGLPNAVFRT